MTEERWVDCNEWQGYDIRSDSFREAKPECTEAHTKKKNQTKNLHTANENISTV